MPIFHLQIYVTRYPSFFFFHIPLWTLFCLKTPFHRTLWHRPVHTLFQYLREHNRPNFLLAYVLHNSNSSIHAIPYVLLTTLCLHNSHTSRFIFLLCVTLNWYDEYYYRVNMWPYVSVVVRVVCTLMVKHVGDVCWHLEVFPWNLQDNLYAYSSGRLVLLTQKL